MIFLVVLCLFRVIFRPCLWAPLGWRHNVASEGPQAIFQLFSVVYFALMLSSLQHNKRRSVYCFSFNYPYKIKDAAWENWKTFTWKARDFLYFLKRKNKTIKKLEIWVQHCAQCLINFFLYTPEIDARGSAIGCFFSNTALGKFKMCPPSARLRAVRSTRHTCYLPAERSV